MDLRILFDLLDKRPFEPFDILLENGRRIQVSHLENIFLAPNRRNVRWIIVSHGDDFTTINPKGITAYRSPSIPDNSYLYPPTE